MIRFLYAILLRLYRFCSIARSVIQTCVMRFSGNVDLSVSYLIKVYIHVLRDATKFLFCILVTEHVIQNL